MGRSRRRDRRCTLRARPGAVLAPENGAVAHTSLCVAAHSGPAGGQPTRKPRGTGVATQADMNTTRTIESTLDVAHYTQVASTEAPVDALATKVFAATMAYVVIFVIATVLLIAL